MKKILAIAIMLLVPIFAVACGSQETANSDALTSHVNELVKTLDNPMDDSTYEHATAANSQLTSEALKTNKKTEKISSASTKINNILIKAHKEKRSLTNKESDTVTKNVQKIIEIADKKDANKIYKKSKLETFINTVGE